MTNADDDHPARLKARIARLRAKPILGHNRADRRDKTVARLEALLDAAGCQRDDFCNCGCNALI